MPRIASKQQKTPKLKRPGVNAELRLAGVDSRVGELQVAMGLEDVAMFDSEELIVSAFMVDENAENAVRQVCCGIVISQHTDT